MAFDKAPPTSSALDSRRADIRRDYARQSRFESPSQRAGQGRAHPLLNEAMRLLNLLALSSEFPPLIAQVLMVDTEKPLTLSREDL